jgi:ketosteroid isomerase-like protein
MHHAGPSRIEIAPVDLVRRAYKALARRDGHELWSICDRSLELRPVDGLGLVGDTLHGLDATCQWLERRYPSDYRVSISLGTLEQVSSGCVLVVGVVSERGRTDRGYAANVAWVWRVRDGRIQSVHGYPSEADARRALSDSLTVDR